MTDQIRAASKEDSDDNQGDLSFVETDSSMTPPWLPNSGLLREHYEYATWATDAPPAYHVASMATAMASVVADKATLIIENHKYPLHMWAMMVGRSTSDRKTTSTRLATQRIENVIATRIQRIYGSPEGVLQALTVNPCVCLYVPEGGAFFAQREASYWKHARDIFMDLYDYTNVFERKLVKDTFAIKNPRISILSACAFPLLERYTKDTDWLGGFLARFLMVTGDPQPFKKRPRSDERTENRIEDLVYNIMQRQWGAMGCTSQARAILDDFAAEIHDEIDNYPMGIAPSLNRLPETATRLAALYEIAARADVAATGGIVLVSKESATCAAYLCRASRDFALGQLGELAAPAGPARDIARTESIIRRSGIAGIGKSALMRATRYHADALSKILDTLSESELIYGSQSPSPSGTGRPTHKYVHVEAKTDAIKASKIAASNPKHSATWVDLSGKIRPDLSSLPLWKGPPPGVPYSDDPDDPDDPNAPWMVNSGDPSWIPPDDDDGSGSHLN